MRTIQNTERRGSALVVAMIMVTSLGTLSLAILSTVSSSYRLNRQVRTESSARYVAEAGIGEAIYDLSQGGLGSLGRPKQRLDYGGGTYWVETEAIGGGRLSIISTGLEGTAAARIQVVLDLSAGSLYSWGAFGDEGLSMSSNTLVDSYDSGAGSYDDQAVNGNGADTYANQEGNVGSNDSVFLDQNATVNGDAIPGPTGTTTISGSNAEVTGSISPAPITSDMPAIEVPATPSLGDLLIASNDTYSLPPGDHAFDDLGLGNGGTLLVQGPATVVFHSATMRAGSEVLVDASNGPVQFYVMNDFLMNANTSFGSTTQIPSDVELNLLSDNIINPDATVDLDTVDFDSNAKFYGTIYAPNAEIVINSNFELFGSLIARAVRLDSWARIHFDEALLESKDESTDFKFSKVFWRELTVVYSEVAY